MFKLGDIWCDTGMTSGTGVTVSIEPGDMYKVKIEDTDQPATIYDFSENYFTVAEE